MDPYIRYTFDYYRHASQVKTVPVIMASSFSTFTGDPVSERRLGDRVRAGQSRRPVFGTGRHEIAGASIPEFAGKIVLRRAACSAGS